MIESLPSPDQRVVAEVVRQRCGGLSADRMELALRQRDAGRADAHVVFERRDAWPVDVSWSGSSHLCVRFEQEAAFRIESQWRDVTIDYQMLPPAAKRISPYPQSGERQ